MKQAFLTWYIALALCLFTIAGNGSTVSWKNGASGNWSDPSNWHPSQVPGPSDTAVITAKGNYTVTVDTNASVGALVLGADDGNTQTLELGGQTFTIGGQATVNTSGFIDLSSGSLDGATNAILTGTFTCSGGSLAGILTLATNSVLNLYGPAGSSNVLNGLVVFTNYGTVNWSNNDLVCPATVICNYGLWDAESNNRLFGVPGNTPVFNNYGTFRKSGGNGTTLLDTNTLFNTTGTLDVEIGGVTLSFGNGRGIFNTATNAGLSLGNFTLAGDATFTGPGPVHGNLSGNNGVIHGGLIFNYGSLSGTLTVASNGVANLVAASGGVGPIDFNLLTLTNYGTVNWRGLSLDLITNSVIDNYGLWDAQDNSSMYGNFGATMAIFNNYGTFRKDGGVYSGSPTGDYSYLNSTTFNNFGTLDTEVGLLQFFSPCNCGSGSVINTASNAIINTGGTFSGDVYFTGAGDFDGGIIGNNAVIHGVVPSTEITLEGTLTLATNGVFYLATVPDQLVSLDGTTFTNYGTVICTSNHLGGGLSPRIYNYGLWDIPLNTEFFGANDGGGGTTTFNNYGTVRKDGNPNGAAIFDNNTTFNNYGLVDVQTGVLALDGTNSFVGGTLNFGIEGPRSYGEVSLGDSGPQIGSLSIKFNNYSPAAGDSYLLDNYSSEAGTFTRLNLPSLPPPLSWQPVYDSDGSYYFFSLNIVSTMPQLSTAANVNGNSISLAWDGLFGQTYQVQCATNLAPPNWVNLGSTIAGTNGPITASDTLTNSPQKFYRIQMQ